MSTYHPPRALCTTMRRNAAWGLDVDKVGDLSYNPDGIIDRTGIAGNGKRISPRVYPPRAQMHFGMRGRLTAILVIAGVIAVLAVALVPADRTVAFPTREGGNCGPGCHPYRTTSFLTVTSSPVISGGLYVPSTTYTFTITLADTNGATGENNFDLILSAGGGTLATTDPNAEINSATEASANDAVSPMTVSTWTVQWTTPASGAVTMNTWAVLSGTATGQSAPYDRITSNLSAGAIPEFATMLVPVFGIAIAVIVISKVSKKRSDKN